MFDFDMVTWKKKDFLHRLGSNLNIWQVNKQLRDVLSPESCDGIVDIVNIKTWPSNV